MQKKLIILLFIILILFASAVFVGCGMDNMDFDFAEKFAGENLDDISLTIYYANPNMFTPFQWDVEHLISMGDGKIVIRGSELEEFIKLFKRINNAILLPLEERSLYPPPVRFYYIVESKENGKLFDVVMWGSDGSIVFNGVEVKAHYIFYDIIIPFLPGHIAELMGRWRDELANVVN